MVFLDLYRKIKIVNANKVCIIKSGVFYYAINKDALVLEHHCNLDKICYSINVCKCGFPVTAVRKYMNILKYQDIPFVIYSDVDDEFEDFLEYETFEYNCKVFGKVFENNGKELNYENYVKDCFNCKYYEKKLTTNVNSLVDIVSRYLEEIKRFNDYKEENRH